MPPAPALPLDAFPHHATDKLRYADTDRQGHVNNAVFSTLFETGRVELLYDPTSPMADDGAEFVIAKLTLEFRGEIQWPGSVAVGTGVVKLGASSMTLGQAAYQQGACVATAETVIVQIDSGSRAARPLSAAARARLSAFQLPST